MKYIWDEKKHEQACNASFRCQPPLEGPENHIQVPQCSWWSSHLAYVYSESHGFEGHHEMVRWCFAEILRIFWNGDREQVAKAIRELLTFDVPCIGKYRTSSWFSEPT